jgi:hypothetical protein
MKFSIFLKAAIIVSIAGGIYQGQAQEGSGSALTLAEKMKRLKEQKAGTQPQGKSSSSTADFASGAKQSREQAELKSGQSQNTTNYVKRLGQGSCTKDCLEARDLCKPGNEKKQKWCKEKCHDYTVLKDSSPFKKGQKFDMSKKCSVQKAK